MAANFRVHTLVNNNARTPSAGHEPIHERTATHNKPHTNTHQFTLSRR